MFKEIKDELIKERDDLVDYHNDCVNKEEILYANTKKNKTEITGALTIVAYIPVFAAGISLLQRIGIPVTPINVALFMASTTAASVLIAHLSQRLITLYPKIKMRKFTNIKKNREIIKESAHYELEKVKTKKKIEVIDAIYNKVESKENILGEITRDGKYKVTKNNLSEEEINKNYELMLQKYNNKMQELDIIVSQEYLRKKFRDYRKNWNRVPNAISNGVVISLLLSFTTCIALLVNKVTNVPVENEMDFIKQIFSGFIPGLALSPITIPLMIRRSNDNLYAFNELNNTLGEHALEQKPDKEREENLEQNIDKLTNELVELGYSLKETEYALKGLSSNVNDEEKTQSLEKNIEKTWDEVQISEEDVKLSMQEAPAPFAAETIFNEDESLEKKKGYTRKRKR